MKDFCGKLEVKKKMILQGVATPQKCKLLNYQPLIFERTLSV